MRFSLPFKNFRKRREYARKIALNNQNLAALNSENDPDGKRRIKLQQAIFQQRQNLEIFESQIIIAKARRRAIDLPGRRDKPHWWSDDNDSDAPLPDYAITWWLNEYGRTGTAKLVKDEWKKDVEWWIKIVTPLLGVLISLLGLVVALVTILKTSQPAK